MPDRARRNAIRLPSGAIENECGTPRLNPWVRANWRGKLMMSAVMFPILADC